MKGPLYISDDEKKQGTQAEVEAYEAALSPLEAFRLPWSRASVSQWIDANGATFHPNSTFAEAGLPLLNLMPLVEELRQGFAAFYGPRWQQSAFTAKHNVKVRDLLLAYEKALGIEQPS